MTSTPIQAPPLEVIALSRPIVASLTDPGFRDRLPYIGNRLDQVSDVVIFGSDLLDTSDPADVPERADPGIDPSIGATIVGQHTHVVGLVVAAAPQRDHPYNLARRLASIDHASKGRVGVAIAELDRSATAGSPWTSASPSVAVADAIDAIRALWRSFPVDAVVADRDSGVFARSERILAIDHRGAFDITGPFQVPTTPQVWPPVFALEPQESAVPDPPIALDVVLTAERGSHIHRPVDIAGLLRLLDTTPGRTDIRPGTTLRERLGLAPITPLTTGRQVFAAPETGLLDANTATSASRKETGHVR